ncbi:hypothetical protein OG985_47235 [Streptomyces sp. NBC_00289]
MDRLPLTPHDWHGTWNYTLRPEPLAPEPPPPGAEFGRFPAGDKLPAWLRHPSLTGLEPAAFDELTARYQAGAPSTRRSFCPESAPPAAPAPAADGSPSPTS